MACFLHELPIIVVPIHLPKFPLSPWPLSNFWPPGGFGEKSALSAGLVFWFACHSDWWSSGYTYTHKYLGHCGAVCVCVNHLIEQVAIAISMMLPCKTNLREASLTKFSRELFNNETGLN